MVSARPQTGLIQARAARGIRSTQAGLAANVALVLVKLAAGLVGHSYALIADALESSSDIFASLIVWFGLHLAAQPADDNHPFGHGKAEPLATMAVSLMLVGAAIAIAAGAVHLIQTPHRLPEPFTLAVAGLAFLVKIYLYRRVNNVGSDIGSTVIRADAWHHLSDAISSGAAFIGITIALIGGHIIGGRGWESADDWAALVAAGVVAFNGAHMLRPALADLMDTAPSAALIERVRQAAASTPGVELVEHLKMRRSGLGYFVELHVQADPAMSLHDSHELSGSVKGAILAVAPFVQGVLVHMEPYLAK
jgi:cation diffusion facilitator family transporter